MLLFILCSYKYKFYIKIHFVYIIFFARWGMNIVLVLKTITTVLDL